MTGSSSGFGELIVKTLARDGHRVFATMRGAAARNRAAAEQLGQWATANHARLEVVELDVTSDHSVTSAVDYALTSAGTIDVVVNNAGASAAGPLEAFSLEQMAALLNLNTRSARCGSTRRSCRQCARRLGLIAWITSTLGRVLPGRGGGVPPPVGGGGPGGAPPPGGPRGCIPPRKGTPGSGGPFYFVAPPSGCIALPPGLIPPLHFVVVPPGIFDAGLPGGGPTPRLGRGPASVRPPPPARGVRRHPTSSRAPGPPPRGGGGPLCGPGGGVHQTYAELRVPLGGFGRPGGVASAAGLTDEWQS